LELRRASGAAGIGDERHGRTHEHQKKSTGGS
jgi:hypothetical protein